MTKSVRRKTHITNVWEIYVFQDFYFDSLCWFILKCISLTSHLLLPNNVRTISTVINREQKWAILIFINHVITFGTNTCLIEKLMDLAFLFWKMDGRLQIHESLWFKQKKKKKIT